MRIKGGIGPISHRRASRRLFYRRLSVGGLLLPLLVIGLLVGPVERANAAFPVFERDTILGSQETVKAGVTSTGVDSQGNMYIAHDGGYLKKFDSSFNFLAMWSTPYGAMSDITSIFVDTADNVWATDIANHSVYKFSNTGTLLMHIGGGATGLAGTGNTQFNTPRDIVVDTSGNIYVSDTGYHRIKKFNSAGVFQWVTAGTTSSTLDGRFNNPGRLALSSNGTLYVADIGNDRIQAINPTTGAYISKFGYTGGGLYCQTMSGMKGMTIDPATDTIYVSVNGLLCDNIYRFDLSGTYLGRFSDMGIRNYIRYHSGTLYSNDGSTSYANTSYSTISRINATTGAITASYGTGINNGDLRGNILAVTTDSNGNTYVADANNRVTKFDANGNFLAIIADYGTVNPDDLRLVSDMAVGPNDDLYILDTTRRTILQFDAAGTFVRTIGATGTADGQFNANPTSITVADDGSIFASATTYVNKYASDGTYVSKITNFPSGTGFANLTSIAKLLTDSQNNLRVMWSNGTRVTTYNSSGTYVSGLTISDLGAAGSSDDFTIGHKFAIDSFDNLYAYNYSQQKVAIINSAGKIQTSWAMTTFMPTWPMKHPNGSITSFTSAFYIDPETNRMFITHRYADWLEVVEPTGLVTPPSAPQNIAAAANGNGINVTWDAPANTNNGPVRSYTVQYRPDDFGSWLTAGTVAHTVTNYTVPNLVADGYQTRVLATNDAGNSVTASAASVNVAGRASFVSRRPIGPTNAYITAAGVDKTNGEIYMYDDGSTGFMHVYDSTLTELRTFSSSGSGPGQLLGARDIEFGPDNRLYVADYTNNRVSIFEKNGTPVTQWGVAGAAAGQLADPADLTFDTDGTLIVTNEYGRVQRFQTDGTFVEQLAPEADQAVSTVVDGDGNLYAMNASYDVNAKIYKYGPDGSLITSFGNGNGDQTGEFWEVYDMDITPDDELVFNDTWNARVHFYSLDGQYLETIGYPHWDAIDGQNQYMSIEEAYETEVLPDGTLYVFNKGYTEHSIITLQVNGGTPPPVTTPSAPQNASRTVNGQNVQVSWSAPSSNGGGSITGYQVRHKLTSDASWTTVNVDNATFTTTLSNLAAGTHDITIAAQNSAGIGSVATLSATIAAPDPSPTTPPSAPQAVTRSVSGRNVNVNWQPPANNGGGPITGYKVRYRKNPLPTWSAVSLAGNATSTTINNLENGTYDITVSAENSLGEGAVATITATINEPVVTPTPTPEPEPEQTPAPSTPAVVTPAPAQTPTPEATDKDETAPEDETPAPTTTAPVTTITEPGAKSPTVTWIAPINFPVKEYLIEFSPQPLEEWQPVATVPSTTLRYTVDLPSGDYLFRVTAISTTDGAKRVIGTTNVTVAATTPTQLPETETTATNWLAPVLTCVGLVAAALLFIIPIWWKKRRKKQPSFLG